MGLSFLDLPCPGLAPPPTSPMGASCQASTRGDERAEAPEGFAAPSPTSRRRGWCRSRKASSQGAALLEAIVVLPFFLLLFSAMAFIGHVYDRKLTHMAQARESAWHYAMKGCEGARPSPPSPSEGTHHLDRTPGTPGPAIDTRAAGPLDRAQGTETLRRRLGKAEAAVSSTMVSDRLLGNTRKTIAIRVQVPCNEVPRDSTLLDVMKDAWSHLSGF